MDVLTTYLLGGASGQGGVPYKLWQLSQSPASVTFDSYDNIILNGFSYPANPYTSQRNAGTGSLNPTTNAIRWNKRYAIGHSFSDNASTSFGKAYYNASADKVWFGATYASVVTLNPSTGEVVNSISPDTGYPYNILNVSTSDLQTFYGTHFYSNVVRNYKFTSSSPNTISVNWYSTWSNTASGGVNESYLSFISLGSVIAGGNKQFHMVGIYNRDSDSLQYSGIVATNSDGSSGNWWRFNQSNPGQAINEPYGGIFRDHSGNIYISKGFASRYSSYPNRRLVSYNTSMGHRYTYYPSLPGYVSSGNPNLGISVLGYDSSDNLYLGVGPGSAGNGYSVTRIAKVNQSKTILWQYSTNITISSVVMHPTDPDAILLLFSNGLVMTQTSDELITGTWGTLTISESTDLSLVSEGEYWPALLNSGVYHLSMTWNSQTTPSGSPLTANITNQSGLSVTSTTIIA